MLESTADLTVYHGGAQPVTGAIRAPFFVTPEIEMAASYADERGKYRGNGQGYLTQYWLKPTKIADADDVAEAAMSLGVGEDEINEVSTFEFLSPTFRNDAHAIIGELVKQGFDCATFYDFGMHDSRAEYRAYCVFNPAVLDFEAIIPVG